MPHLTPHQLYQDLQNIYELALAHELLPLALKAKELQAKYFMDEQIPTLDLEKLSVDELEILLKKYND